MVPALEYIVGGVKKKPCFMGICERGGVHVVPNCIKFNCKPLPLCYNNAPPPTVCLWLEEVMYKIVLRALLLKVSCLPSAPRLPSAFSCLSPIFPTPQRTAKESLHVADRQITARFTRRWEAALLT